MVGPQPSKLMIGVRSPSGAPDWGIFLAYLIWVPLIIAFYSYYAYVSKLNNDSNNYNYIVWIMILGAFPGWALVSKFSKNLLFDGMLYDNIMFLTYVSTMIALGAHSKLSPHQWIGIGAVIIGSIMIRIDV